jgi:hypothetical protein
LVLDHNNHLEAVRTGYPDSWWKSQIAASKIGRKRVAEIKI